jgi:hypothetical protein
MSSVTNVYDLYVYLPAVLSLLLLTFSLVQSLPLVWVRCHQRPTWVQANVGWRLHYINGEQGEDDRVNGSKPATACVAPWRYDLHCTLSPCFCWYYGVLTVFATHHRRSSQSAWQHESLCLTNLEVLVNTVLYGPSASLHFIGVHQAGMDCMPMNRCFYWRERICCWNTNGALSMGHYSSYPASWWVSRM